jgi:hypothetical protein
MTRSRSRKFQPDETPGNVGRAERQAKGEFNPAGSYPPGTKIGRESNWERNYRERVSAATAVGFEDAAGSLRGID